MKNKIALRFIFAILIVIFLTQLSSSSCSKGVANFVLSGTITDVTFSQGHAGAVLKLSKVMIATGEEILLETKTLGTDGSYEFTFPREKVEKYIIRVVKPLYFDVVKEIQFSSLTVMEPNIRNYSTKAKSWVELRFVNTSVATNDHFRFIKFQGLEGCDECCTAEQVDLYAVPYYSRTCINEALSTYSIYYQVIGTTTQDIVEVITQPFDTTLLLVNY
ncbi:MAG: hypothetical protein FJX84_03245 [Bacteroidetes bacterium]|nr:hypothetical protein [Bacteroidota bacterium]